MTSRQIFLDKTGMWTSAMCAVHCIAVPIAISMSAFSSWAILHDEHLENFALLVSGIIGVTSLVPSYLSHHKRLMPIVILLSGFVLIGLSRFAVEVNESVFTSCGAALVASAHLLNHRFCRSVLS